MDDRATVIEGLTDVMGYLRIKMFSDGCAGKMVDTIRQAKKLLEMECVTPVRDNSWPLLNVWVCPECNGITITPVSVHPKYCAGCGRKVKWDEKSND